MNTPNGSMIKVKPWMEIPGDDFYLIKYDKIITMTEIKDKMVISIYNNYIEEEDPNATKLFKDNQIKVTKKAISERRIRTKKLLILKFIKIKW